MAAPDVLRHVCSMTVGLVFLAAGGAKLASPPEEAGSAWSQLTVFPPWLRKAAARLLPIVEVTMGGILLVNLGLYWSSFAAAALLGAFTVVVVSLRLAGKRVRCGCFGDGGDGEVQIGLFLARNAGLILLAIVGQGSDIRELSPIQVLLGVGLALLVMALYALLASHHSVPEVSA